MKARPVGDFFLGQPICTAEATHTHSRKCWCCRFLSSLFLSFLVMPVPYDSTRRLQSWLVVVVAAAVAVAVGVANEASCLIQAAIGETLLTKRGKLLT